MRRFCTALWLGCIATTLLLAAPQALARKPRFAVVNVGPADYDTAGQLLLLYKLLPPKTKPTTSPPSRVAPRPPAVDARKAPRQVPRARRALPTLPLAELSAPVRGRALRRALAGLPHDEARAVAAIALQRGKLLYSTLKRKKAAESFARAIATYDSHVAWSQARPALVEACTYLLLCHHALGRKGEAVKVAARLRELTGNKAPKGVPAGIWAAYPLVPLPLSPRRTIGVMAPAKARVILDDRPVGLGPQQLAVGPGAHRIRVELAGHRVFHQVVAAGTSTQTVMVTLVPRATDAYADIRKELSKVRRGSTRWGVGPIKSLSKRLFIDHVLVCVLEGGSLRTRWYSARMGKFASPVLSLPRPGAGDLRKPVLAAFAKVARDEKKRGKSLAVPIPHKKKKTTKLWKKWYFWVAAAVVAGVVAAFAIKDSVTEEKVFLRVTRP